MLLVISIIAALAFLACLGAFVVADNELARVGGDGQ